VQLKLEKIPKVQKSSSVSFYFILGSARKNAARKTLVKSIPVHRDLNFFLNLKICKIHFRYDNKNDGNKIQAKP